MSGENYRRGSVASNTWISEATCERPLTEGHKRRLQACHMLSERGFGVFKKGAYRGVHSETLPPSESKKRVQIFCYSTSARMWEFKGASGSCESVCGQYEIHDIRGKSLGNYEREDSPLTPSTRSK